MLTLEQLDKIALDNAPDAFGCIDDVDEDGSEWVYIFENGMMRVNVLNGDFALIPNN